MMSVAIAMLHDIYIIKRRYIIMYYVGVMSLTIKFTLYTCYGENVGISSLAVLERRFKKKRTLFFAIISPFKMCFAHCFDNLIFPYH